MSVGRLHGLNKKELVEIFNKLNEFEWDYRIGPKPYGWDDLENYKPYYRLSKATYISPFIYWIKTKVGEKACLEYHHINNLGETKLEYEIWWFKRKLRILFTGSAI